MTFHWPHLLGGSIAATIGFAAGVIAMWPDAQPRCHLTDAERTRIDSLYAMVRDTWETATDLYVQIDEFNAVVIDDLRTQPTAPDQREFAAYMEALATNWACELNQMGPALRDADWRRRELRYGSE